LPCSCPHVGPTKHPHFLTSGAYDGNILTKHFEGGLSCRHLVALPLTAKVRVNTL
ncbi:hypothetical protein AMECASPLE_005488, partial [Ameca splendens]